MMYWNDAYSRTGWRDSKEAVSEPLHVTSIGIFLNSDKEFLYTTHGRFEGTDTIADIAGVPWGMITKVEKL